MEHFILQSMWIGSIKVLITGMESLSDMEIFQPNNLQHEEAVPFYFSPQAAEKLGTALRAGIHHLRCKYITAH